MILFTKPKSAVQGSKQSVIHLVPRHGLPDVRKNEALHVLELILQVLDADRNERGDTSKRERRPPALKKQPISPDDACFTSAPIERIKGNRSQIWLAHVSTRRSNSDEINREAQYNNMRVLLTCSPGNTTQTQPVVGKNNLFFISKCIPCPCNP